MENPQIFLSKEKKKPLKLDNSEFISANDFSITEEEKNRAREELSETEEKITLHIEKLRVKLASDKDANYRTEEDYLLRYLRVRKFDVKKAYKNIKDASSFRRKYQETLRITPNLKSLLNLNFFSFLPYVDENGRVLICTKLAKWNCEEVSFVEIMQLAHAVLDIITMNPRCQINGVTSIWDMKGASMGHLASIAKTISVGSISYFFQTYYPIRLKNVYVINSSSIFQVFYKIIRPFVSKKISQRIFILGSDLSDLHQHVNPAILPADLGGSLDEDKCNITETIMDNLPYLKYERSFN